MMTQRLKLIIPFTILFALLGLLWHELFYAKPTEPPSALIGENLPDFKLPSLFQPAIKMTPSDLAGRPVLLNIWATWCYACSLEMPMLKKIQSEYRVPIYSIDYKDNPDDAKKWLKHYGNPYVMTGMDTNGDTAIDLGVYGTPETFVINPEGKILYRHVGIIDQAAWDHDIYPLIKQYDEADNHA